MRSACSCLATVLLVALSWHACAQDDNAVRSNPQRSPQAALIPRGEPLDGTEYVVTFPEGETSHNLAARAAEAKGIPVTVLRELTGNRAVIGIDRERLAAQIEAVLHRFGQRVERVEPRGLRPMGKKPPPRFRVGVLDALQNFATPPLFSEPYADAVAAEILETTRLPTKVYRDDRPDSILVVAAGRDLALLLEQGILATPGATAEPVRMARPFVRGN